MSESTIKYLLKFYPKGKIVYNKMDDSDKEKMKNIILWTYVVTIMLLISVLPMPYNEFIRIWFYIGIIIICIKVVLTGKPLNKINNILFKMVFFPYLLISGYALFFYLNINKKKYE